MANKSQEALLSEVVGLLRKQNQLSTRDRLRESEEAKRAEKLALQGEVTNEGQSTIIDGAQDFQRRFLAGQAKTTVDSARKDTPKGVIQRALLKSSDGIKQVLTDANKMGKAWRLQDRRDANEAKLEAKKNRPPSPLVAGAKAGKKWFDDEKESGIIQTAWDKTKWTLMAALATSVWLASEGFNLWAKNTIKAFKSIGKWAGTIKTWPGSFTTIGAKVDGWRISILKWFGYDKNGKPILGREKLVTKVGPQGGLTKIMSEWKPIKFAAMAENVRLKLATMRANAYKMVGLGVDGKPLGNRFGPNPHGSGARSMPQGLKRGFGTGFFRTVTSQIGKIISPVLRLSAAVTTWTAGTTGAAVKKTLKGLGGTLLKFPGVKLIGRLLWPVTLLFSIFEGFKAGSEEAEREGSNWYTILGEGTGGVLGYIFGGLIDLVKNGAIWLITKGFGLDTDEDGKIIGDGLGVKVLNIIKEFSFMDLIRKVIAAPFHLVSNVVGFLTKMFTDADYRAGVWEWIKEIPSRIVNWVKEKIPQWARDLFGIEIGETGALGDLSQAALSHIKHGQLVEFTKSSQINPMTGTFWGVNPETGKKEYNNKKFKRHYYIEQQMRAFKDGPDAADLQAAFIATEDQKTLNRAIAKANPPSQMINNVQVINFDAGKYGNMVTTAEMAMGI